MTSAKHTSKNVRLNFGDPEEEAQAYGSGDRQKLSKVTKKVQTERLLLANVQEILKDDTLRMQIMLPFLGNVSTLKGAQGFEICRLFDVPFYVNPPPAPNATTATIVPAWLVGTTNKMEKASMEETDINVYAVAWMSFGIFESEDIAIVIVTFTVVNLARAAPCFSFKLSRS